MSKELKKEKKEKDKKNEKSDKGEGRGRDKEKASKGRYSRWTATREKSLRGDRGRRREKEEESFPGRGRAASFVYICTKPEIGVYPVIHVHTL